MNKQYGDESATLDAVGGIEGLRQLVNDFYDIMAEASNYQPLKNMHPDNLDESKDKLFCFLSGWMGGEDLYEKNYGFINIPKAHQIFKIGFKERDMWMSCMTDALNKQNYPNSLVDYLIKNLSLPAERIRLASEAHHHSTNEST